MSLPVPLLEVTRGGVVESTHYGSIVVVDSHGDLLASCGDPQTVAFLRSSAKPFQALPFVERDGVEHFGFSSRELALACASHEGSSLHVQTVEGMQKKAGIEESQLQCGSHLPSDPDMFRAFVASGQSPSANYNNCSGKHTAMLAHAKLRGLPLDTYLDVRHPIQQDILHVFSEMCGIRSDAVELGIDGCSAPNFAVPLYHTALGMARLCDPRGLLQQREAACRQITAAMTAYPEMVSGPGEFDCELMKALDGCGITKRGAEGFQVLGLKPGVLGADSPGVGIALKVTDGDASRLSMQFQSTTRVRPAVVLETLRQLGGLSGQQLQALSSFGPSKPVRNHRNIVTGESRPAFTLERYA